MVGVIGDGAPGVFTDWGLARLLHEWGGLHKEGPSAKVRGFAFSGWVKSDPDSHAGGQEREIYQSDELKQ